MVFMSLTNELFKTLCCYKVSSYKRKTTVYNFFEKKAYSLQRGRVKSLLISSRRGRSKFVHLTRKEDIISVLQII